MILTRARDLVETTKPRILVLVMLSTFVGFFLAADKFSASLFFHTLLGTAFVCASCNSLNQLLEIGSDAKMRRTQNRPLPAGRLQPGEVLVFGMVLGLDGLLYLSIAVNVLTALVGAVALASYLFIYTPLKRKTPWCTTVGAVPGAAPVLMGWAAARGSLDLGGWILFIIVFLWQLPHFYAIAMMYSEDYAAAGMPMLPAYNMRMANRQITFYSLGLLFVSILPALMGLAGPVYLCGALILGLLFAGMGLGLALNKWGVSARMVFFASIIYLPLLFTLMVMNKI